MKKILNCVFLACLISLSSCDITGVSKNGKETKTQNPITQTSPKVTTSPEVKTSPLVSTDKNSPPIVSSFTVDPGNTVAPGMSVVMEIKATDKENDVLDYTWSSSGGRLSTDKGTKVTWSAPLEEGTFSVLVVVHDGKGGNTQATENIIVKIPDNDQLTISEQGIGPELKVTENAQRKFVITDNGFLHYIVRAPENPDQNNSNAWQFGTIIYTFSRDKAKTWEEPKVLFKELKDNFDILSFLANGNDLIIVYASYESRVMYGSFMANPGKTSIYATSSQNNGISWSSPTLLAEIPYEKALYGFEQDIRAWNENSVLNILVRIRYYNGQKDFNELHLYQSQDSGFSWSQKIINLTLYEDMTNMVYFNKKDLSDIYALNTIKRKELVPGVGTVEKNELVLLKSKDGMNWGKPLTITELDQIYNLANSNANLYPLSNGNLILFVYKDKLDYFISEDNGETWSLPKKFEKGGSPSIKFYLETFQNNVYLKISTGLIKIENSGQSLKFISTQDNNSFKYGKIPLDWTIEAGAKFLDKNNKLHLITPQMHTTYYDIPSKYFIVDNSL